MALVGDDCNEQIVVGALFLMVIDWAQAEFGFQGSENGFDIGK